MDIFVENWGLIQYSKAHQRQKEIVQEVIDKKRAETLILCRHRPVVTLGKQSTPEDLLGWSGETFQVERGGRATYHGPEQIVVYPILNLKNRGQNIGGLLQIIQKVLVELLQKEGLKARGTPSYAGVWVHDSGQNIEKKIASIGIAVKKWVTYHGLALNISKDPLAFKGIASCGLQSGLMTYLEEHTKRKIHREYFERELTTQLLKAINSDLPVQVKSS